MIFRNLSSDNDWLFGRGIQNFTTNSEALRLNLKTRLQEWKGDCFYATESGVDYNNLLSVGTQSLLDSDVKRVILQSEGVLKITSFESEIDPSNREYSGRAEIVTIFGSEVLEF